MQIFSYYDLPLSFMCKLQGQSTNVDNALKNVQETKEITKLANGEGGYPTFGKRPNFFRHLHKKKEEFALKEHTT